MPKEVIQVPGSPKGPLPFSPAIRAGGFVFVSGQASVDENGQIVRESFEGEMRRSMENVRKVLKAAGLDLKDVVRVCSYVARQEDLAEYNRIYREYFSEPYPARTSVQAGLPPGVLVEIEAVARRGS